MRINEVSVNAAPDPDKLIGLVSFLRGRADDTASDKKQISQAAFMDLAQQLGINLTVQNLSDMASKPPLSNLLEPVDINSGVVVFKGGEPSVTAMPVNRAQDIVAQAAKSALKKRT